MAAQARRSPGRGPGSGVYGSSGGAGWRGMNARIPPLHLAREGLAFCKAELRRLPRTMTRDTLIALSTSGNSENMILALEEARRREMGTIALVGYDGGRVAGEGLADHVVVTRSQHIPRIQEAQASAYHVLRELVELSGSGGTAETR